MSTIYASTLGAIGRSATSTKEPIPCVRCGMPRVIRESRRGRPCADCRLTMTREDLERWT